MRASLPFSAPADHFAARSTSIATPAYRLARSSSVGMLMRRIAEFVLRHRRLIGIGWVVVVIAGIALTQRTTNRLVVDFSLPGQPGTQTANQIDQEFHAGGKTAPYIVTITLPAGQAVSQRSGAINQ